ncbi:hypothetical protein Taro_041675 [Colocasia esculenta]|uniref:Uncharacterized protein n=1 Tax=Colocasia esculenta TaxID=4460 RepID=A0A843WQK7_COLES|nr:hypothetical protein [Colocasia esculenta]
MAASGSSGYVGGYSATFLTADQLEHFSVVKIKLCGNKAVDLEDLEKHGMHSVVETLQRLKWTGMCTVSEPSYPHMAKAFYTYLKTEEDGSLTSTVKELMEKMGQPIRSRNLKKSGFSLVGNVWTKTSVAEGEAIIGEASETPQVQEEEAAMREEEPPAPERRIEDIAPEYIEPIGQTTEEVIPPIVLAPAIIEESIAEGAAHIEGEHEDIQIEETPNVSKVGNAIEESHEDIVPEVMALGHIEDVPLVDAPAQGELDIQGKPTANAPVDQFQEGLVESTSDEAAEPAVGSGGKGKGVAPRIPLLTKKTHHKSRKKKFHSIEAKEIEAVKSKLQEIRCELGSLKKLATDLSDFVRVHLSAPAPLAPTQATRVLCRGIWAIRAISCRTRAIIGRIKAIGPYVAEDVSAGSSGPSKTVESVVGPTGPQVSVVEAVVPQGLLTLLVFRLQPLPLHLHPSLPHLHLNPPRNPFQNISLLPLLSLLPPLPYLSLPPPFLIQLLRHLLPPPLLLVPLQLVPPLLDHLLNLLILHLFLLFIHLLHPPSSLSFLRVDFATLQMPEIAFLPKLHFLLMDSEVATQLENLNSSLHKSNQLTLTLEKFMDLNSINLVLDHYSTWVERYKICVALQKDMLAHNLHYPLSFDKFLQHASFGTTGPYKASLSSQKYTNFIEEQILLHIKRLKAWKYKKKAMAAAWNNENDSDSESSFSKEEEEKANLAFMANIDDKLKSDEDGAPTSFVKGTEYKLREGMIDINQFNAFNRIMIEKMKSTTELIWDKKSKLAVSLPYAHMFTRIFRHFEVDLEDELMEKMRQPILTRNLKKSGFSLSANIWSKTSMAEGEAIIGDSSTTDPSAQEDENIVRGDEHAALERRIEDIAPELIEPFGHSAEGDVLAPIIEPHANLKKYLWKMLLLRGSLLLRGETAADIHVDQYQEGLVEDASEDDDDDSAHQHTTFAAMHDEPAVGSGGKGKGVSNSIPMLTRRAHNRSKKMKLCVHLDLVSTQLDAHGEFLCYLQSNVTSFFLSQSSQAKDIGAVRSDLHDMRIELGSLRSLVTDLAQFKREHISTSAAPSSAQAPPVPSKPIPEAVAGPSGPSQQEQPDQSVPVESVAGPSGPSELEIDIAEPIGPSMQGEAVIEPSGPQEHAEEAVVPPGPSDPPVLQTPALSSPIASFTTPPAPEPSKKPLPKNNVMSSLSQSQFRGLKQAGPSFLPLFSLFPPFPLFSGGGGLPSDDPAGELVRSSGAAWSEEEAANPS